MKKENYKKKIKKQIQIDSKQITNFDTSIIILSEILEERDRIYELYQEKGAQPLVMVTSDRGAENLKPNPLLKQWNELNTTALQYLRELGITPAGLKKIQSETPQKNTLELFLNKLEGEEL